MQKNLRLKYLKMVKPIYESPSVIEIREFSQKETAKLWPEVLRFENPHAYYVDLSQNLWNLKQDLLHKYTDSFEK